MNRFVFKMAWREARTSYRHLLFFVASIAIGVGSVVGVGNLSANLEKVTHREARTLLAADLEARINRPLSAQGMAYLSELESQGIRHLLVTDLTGMAMTESSERTQLVEIKASEPGYPYYGRLRLDPSVDEPFNEADGIWVQEAVLVRLHLKPGDTLRLGRTRFRIRGIILDEPDRTAGVFSLGPGVLISRRGLDRSGLIQPGSRFTDRYLFKIPDPWTPERFKTELSRHWSSESVRIQTYREAQPRLGRFLGNLTTYLGLVGLLALIVGGVGVASNIHNFLTERIGTIAILKCLGCSTTTISTIYLLLSLFLGGIGSLVGILIGMYIYHLLSPILSSFLPANFTFQPMPTAAIRGLAMGLLVTLLFSIWPMRLIGRWAPSLVFRQEVGIEPKGLPDRRTWALACFILFGCIALSFWVAGSWKLGAWVTAAIGISIPALVAAAMGVLQLIKYLRRRAPILSRSLILRYGIGNLYRPGRPVITVVLSIGIGVTMLLTLAQVEFSLMAHLRENVPRNAPSLFFIDLQPDQKSSFRSMMEGWKLNEPIQLTPLIRSRLYAVNGKPVSEMPLEHRTDDWYFSREYVLTYQEDIPAHNIIRRGTWWGSARSAEAESIPMISAEAEAARHLGIDLGSTVTFDIQGRRITARVASIREVDWGSMTTNFFFIFAPGTLDPFPATYVASAMTPRNLDLPIQNAVADSFPNVTVINLREILERVAGILTVIIRAVRLMAVFGLLGGIIVLSGAIAATRSRRRREMVLLKTLGATRLTLIDILSVEYALLGLIAAVVGSILSTGLSWVVVHYFLEIPWRIDPFIIPIGLAATALVTVAGGFLTTYRILGQKPMAILRSE